MRPGKIGVKQDSPDQLLQHLIGAFVANPGTIILGFEYNWLHFGINLIGRKKILFQRVVLKVNVKLDVGLKI